MVAQRTTRRRRAAGAPGRPAGRTPAGAPFDALLHGDGKRSRAAIHYVAGAAPPQELRQSLVISLFRTGPAWGVASPARGPRYVAAGRAGGTHDRPHERGDQPTTFRARKSTAPVNLATFRRGCLGVAAPVRRRVLSAHWRRSARELAVVGHRPAASRRTRRFGIRVRRGYVAVDLDRLSPASAPGGCPRSSGGRGRLHQHRRVGARVPRPSLQWVVPWHRPSRANLESPGLRLRYGLRCGFPVHTRGWSHSSGGPAGF
jgi:hypothetical protein